MLEDTMSRAHPEEHLRDCDMPYAWAQLKTAPHATFQLKKAIREKWVSSSFGLSGGGVGVREREGVCVSKRERERVCEFVKERECVCVRERESV